jgi:hypothetical protein
MYAKSEQTFDCRGKDRCDVMHLEYPIQGTVQEWSGVPRHAIKYKDNFPTYK